MSLENAKKLLRKAIELQDEELIEMANQALSSVYGDQDSENINIKSAEPESPKHDPLEEHGTPTATEDVFSKDKNQTEQKGDFIFQMRDKNDAAVNNNGVPVNEVKNRFNSFHDDGTEAKDVKTPEVELTERRRPAFKMVEQTCGKCSETFMVHPAHKRDFFVCDKCIPK
tara:strand:+ start:395 stop:904 length:510 start_codon:yes stop_codon:yes gene_type:complete